jgi:hypothetical protein
MQDKLEQAWASQRGRSSSGHGVIAVVFIRIVVLSASPFATSFMRQWSRTDVETRSNLVFNVTRDNMEAYLPWNHPASVNALFEPIVEDGKVLAVGFCDANGGLRSGIDSFSSFHTDGHDPLFGAFPIPQVHGHFVFLHDLSFCRTARRGDSKAFSRDAGRHCSDHNHRVDCGGRGLHRAPDRPYGPLLSVRGRDAVPRWPRSTRSTTTFDNCCGNST